MDNIDLVRELRNLASDLAFKPHPKLHKDWSPEEIQRAKDDIVKNTADRLRNLANTLWNRQEDLDRAASLSGDLDTEIKHKHINTDDDPVFTCNCEKRGWEGAIKTTLKENKS